MTSILLVDDHQILLDGITELITKVDQNQVYARASTAEKALELFRDNPNEIDVVVTDIGLPDMNGIELARQLKKHQGVKVIVLSMHDEQHIVKDAIKAGVDGYVLKRSTHEDLLDAIVAVSAGESYVSSSITEMLMDNIRNPSIIDSLSEREKEIIVLITKEYTTKKIAEELFISEKTVEAHKTNIFRKTNTSTLVGLTKFAIENNLV